MTDTARNEAEESGGATAHNTNLDSDNLTPTSPVSGTDTPDVPEDTEHVVPVAPETIEERGEAGINTGRRFNFNFLSRNPSQGSAGGRRGRSARRNNAAAADDATTSDGATSTTGTSRKGRGATRKDKPKSAAQIKREQDKARRKVPLSVRYSGDRRKILALSIAGVLSVLLLLVTFFIALNKPGFSAMDKHIDQKNEQAGAGFPSGQAVMWAGQVLRVWGTWDQNNATAHQTAVAQFLSAGMDGQAGWNGKGSQQVIYSSLNPTPHVTGPNHATIDATYQIQDSTWHCISIPVYAYKPSNFSANQQWAFALAGNPTPVACAARTGAPDQSDTDPDALTAGGKTADTTTGTQLAQSYFPGFFAAYAASDASALTQYTASGVSITGLGGAMSSIPNPSIGNTIVYVDSKGISENTVYQALVPVTWTLANSTSQVTATYLVPIQRKGDRWYVVGEPVAAPQSPEAQGGAPADIPQPGNGNGDGAATASAQAYNTPSTTPTTAKPTVNPTVKPAATKPAATKAADAGKKK